MEGKKIFLLSFIIGLVIFSLCVIIFAMFYSEIFDFVEYFLGI